LRYCLEYISLKSLFFLTLLQLTSFRQARYIYLQDLLLEFLHYFDCFWITFEKIRRYIAKKKIIWRGKHWRIIEKPSPSPSNWVEQELWTYATRAQFNASSDRTFYEAKMGWDADWRRLKQPGYARTKDALQD
jgi:hypothetical protein